MIVIQAKIGGILYDRAGKPGREFWNRIRVLGSDYKSLVNDVNVIP